MTRSFLVTLVDDTGPYPEAVSIRARPVRFECEFRGKALVTLASLNPRPSTLNPKPGQLRVLYSSNH